MADLPTGTVTLLFTDIEGSTRLLQSLGPRYAEVLAEYRRLLRVATHSQDGREVGTEGDGCFFAFRRAKGALAAAVAAMRAIDRYPWPAGITVPVRMGLHTGEPVSADTGYVGMDVHRAARICAVGHGGQMLLSQTTRDLVADDLPQGISLRDLGQHRLKDLAGRQYLFQVVAAELPTDFPPLNSLDALPNNLPTQLTSFIGREREKAEVRRLLSTTRLLTLTGAGGSGKTRLALQVAADRLEEYPDGVWQVELAPLADPSLVPRAVASALGVSEQPSRALTEVVADYLRSKTLLLIFDNCEHVLPACAQLADFLLRACPSLRMLATSREALRIAGEISWRVPSMSLPDLEQRLPPPERLMDVEAVRLFVERAAGVLPAFTVTTQNVHAIGQMCHQLDGMPLAIELAAARVKVLSAEQIVARLDDRFRLLTGGSRTALPRHQTLRATMDWSYGLLSEQEQSLLRRLSVFAGGCALEAIEAVCAGGGLAPAEILGLLAQLVDKSLVQVEIREGEARYRLLETVREYGRDRLREAGEAEETRRRHRDWYLPLVERAEPELHGPNQIAWLERLEENHDNIRAAFEWCRTEAGGDAAGLRLAAALYQFWDIRGHFAEGRAWLDQMLSQHKAAAPVLRVKALTRAAHLAHRQGDYARVSALCEEALALAQAEGDKQGRAEALHYLAHAAEGAGDHHRAAELLNGSVALHRAVGNTFELARALNCLANTARVGANYPKAADLYEEALMLVHSLGDKGSMGAITLHNLGYVVLRQGDHQRSWALFRESLALVEELGDKRSMIKCLAGLAGASAEARPEWAARLFGATAALMSADSIRLEPFNRRDFDHYMAMAKGRMSELAFTAAWAQGAAMTLEQAVEYSLTSVETAPLKTEAKKRPGTWKEKDLLTPREREVATFVARGLTNREIAERLVVTQRTAETHVQNILNKLGVTSRAEIAAWAVECGLYTPPTH